MLVDISLYFFACVILSSKKLSSFSCKICKSFILNFSADFLQHLGTAFRRTRMERSIHIQPWAISGCIRQHSTRCSTKLPAFLSRTPRVSGGTTGENGTLSPHCSDVAPVQVSASARGALAWFKWNIRALLGSKTLQNYHNEAQQ